MSLTSQMQPIGDNKPTLVDWPIPASADAPQDPTFSVLVSAYRSEEFIAEMVRSVQAQTRGDWELVIVDNGSPDGLASTVDAFGSDRRIRLVRLPTNVGVSAARNIAARLARGRLLCVVDSDDAIEPPYLREVGAIYNAHPDVGLVGCKPSRIDTHGDPIPGRRTGSKRIDWSDRERALVALIREPFDYHGLAVSREIFHAVGGYNERLAIGEDADLWIRIAAAGHRLQVIDSPLYRYRVHVASVTADPTNAVSVAAGNLVALQSLARAIPMTAARQAALEENARRTRTALSLAEMRAAVRRGEPARARSEARRVAQGAPSIRSVLMMLIVSLPWPVVRRIYAMSGRASLIGTTRASPSPRRVRGGWRWPNR